MFPSLETKLKRFEELERQLQDPSVLSNTNRLLDVQREYGGLKKVAESVRAHYALQADLASARELLEEESDPDAKAYALNELEARGDEPRRADLDRALRGVEALEGRPVGVLREREHPLARHVAGLLGTRRRDGGDQVEAADRVALGREVAPQLVPSGDPGVRGLDHQPAVGAQACGDIGPTTP